VRTIISSAGKIVNKTRSSLEANTEKNMLLCWRSRLSVKIWVRKRLCYLQLLTESWVKYHNLINTLMKQIVIEINY